jgi:8-oxo-dGTP diphosphatase
MKNNRKTIQNALTILEKDKPNNISIINFIKDNFISSVDIAGNSVLVRGESDHRWVYISSRDKNQLDLLTGKLNTDDNYFAVIDEWIMPVLVGRKEVVWDLFMDQYYLPDNIRLPSAESKTEQLKERDADIIYNNSDYKEYVSMEYIKDRIQKGISAGIYENNKLVSWAMTHDDGAIGFLYTLENFRRKGYGYIVTLSIIEKLKSMGKLPFAFIKADNTKSINLFSKIGFKKNKAVHWFHIK